MSFSGIGLPGHITRGTFDNEGSCEHNFDSDTACTNPIVVKMQGETDSFGCEYLYYCDEHHKIWLAEQESDNEDGYCDSCHADGVSTSPTRDPDEGMSGPVSYYCDGCMNTFNKHLQASYEAEGH